MLREAQVERLKLKDRNEGLSPEEKALFRELLRDLLGSPCEPGQGDVVVL
jgi:DNA primase